MIRPALFRKSFLFLILPIMFGLLVGCGKKGPVRPIAQPVPSAPPEFNLLQQGLEMLLTWSLPQFNENGTPLTDLAGFRIYRGLYDPADDCPTCLQTPELWRVVDLEYLRDVQRVGDRFFLIDDSPKIGQGYQYRIIPFNRWGQDGQPALARQVIVEPPSPPEGVAVTREAGRLTLTWQPVKNLPEGMELIGYRVYRRRLDDSFPPAPHNIQPLVAPFFADEEFEAGKTYLYAVRSVVRQNARIIESPLSELVSVRAPVGK